MANEQEQVNTNTKGSNDEENNRNCNNAPKDNYMLIYIIFYWLGMGSLLPWNFFISGEYKYMCTAPDL